MKIIRILGWLGGAVLLLALLIGAGWLQTRQEDSAANVADDSMNFGNIGGDFTAQDQNGKPITAQDLRGKPTLMFFGYTYCPDFCPTTLLEMTNWLKKLGKDADKLNVVFVTVDPKRDTPAHMKEYLSSFDPHIRAIIPTEAEVKNMSHSYHFYYEKVGDGDDYLVNHSAGVYLFDSQGKFVGMIDNQENRQTAFEKVQMLFNRN